MLKVTCINCGNKYQVKDELAGKTLKCPQCGMAIRAAEAEKGPADEAALRAEILRLAGSKPGQKPPGEAAAEALPREKAAEPAKKARPKSPVKPGKGAKEQPSEPEDEERPATHVGTARRDYTALVIGVFVVMAIALGGFLFWMRYQAHQRDVENERKAQAAAIKKDYEQVCKVDPACREADAIKAWDAVREKAEGFERAYGGGVFVEIITESGRRAQTLQTALDKRQEDVKRMQDLLLTGKRKLERSDYAGAKKDLEAAVSVVAEQKCPNEGAVKVRDEAKQMLAMDAIVYGSKGWVLYKDKWVTPQQFEDLKRLAEIEEMKAKGLVEFETDKGATEWVTPEEKERRLAERRQKREHALWLEAQRAKVTEQIAEGMEEVVIDPGTEHMRWQAEAWANPAQLSIQEQGENKEKFVAAKLEAGDKDKWVISIDQRSSVVGYERLKIYLCASTPVKVALGVWTMPGFELFESPAQIIPLGCQDVTFDLSGQTFKCRTSNWQHNSNITNAEATYKFSLFIYGRADTAISLRNLRLEGPKKPPAEPEGKEPAGEKKEGDAVAPKKEPPREKAAEPAAGKKEEPAAEK